MLNRPPCRPIAISPHPRGVLAILLVAAGAGTGGAAVDLEQFTPDPRIIDYSVYTSDSIYLPSNSGLASGGLFGSGGGVTLSDGMKLRAPRISVGRSFSLGGHSDSMPMTVVAGNLTVGAGTRFRDTLQVDGDFTSGAPNIDIGRSAAVRGNLALTGGSSIASSLLRLGGTYASSPLSFGPAAQVQMTAASGGPVLPAAQIRYSQPFVPLLPAPLVVGEAALPAASIQDYAPPATRPAVDLSTPRLAGDAQVRFLSPDTTTAYYWECNLGASHCRGDTLLPGYYGNLAVTGNGRAILLTEGFYSFTSISLGGGNAIIAAQPKGGRTVIHAENGVTANSSHAFIGPDGGRLATGFGAGPGKFLGGTLMLSSGADIRIPSDNRIWATLTAPHGEIHMSSQVTLFGQAYARRLIGDNNIDFGEGAFIPFRQIPLLTGPALVIPEQADPACSDPSGRPCRDTLVTVSIPYVTAYDASASWRIVEASPRSARGGIDFLLDSGAILIPSNTTRATIPVRIFADSSHEGSESFHIELSKVASAGFPDSAGKLDTTIRFHRIPCTIVDDDLAPLLRIFADSAVQEGDAGMRPLTFAARLYDPVHPANPLSAASAPELPVRFHWLVEDGSATLGDRDYLAQGGAWDSIPAFSLTRPLAVQIQGDLRYENDERLVVRIDTAIDATLPGAVSDTGAIRNDDAPPSVTFTGVDVDEPARYGDSAWVVFNFRISAASGLPTSVHWRTADSSARGTVDFAVSPGDFLARGGMLVVPPDSLTGMVRIAVFGDTLFEKREILGLGLDSLVNASAGNRSAWAAITDADSAPAVSVFATRVREPLAGRATARFAVRLARPSGLPASFAWSTADGTARAELDYAAVARGEVRLPAFVRDTVLEVAILADSLAGEGDETFEVRLADLVDMQPGVMAATGVILDGQDGFRLTLDSVAPVAEADSIVRFAVRTDWIPAHPIRLAYRTLEGTARKGFRYADTAGALVLPAGSRTGSIAVRISKDSLWEPLEFFTLHLDSITGANAPVATDSAARAWIYEEEELLFWFDSRDTAVREDSAGRVLATVRLSQPATIPIAFRLPIRPGSTASMPADFLVTTEGWTWPALARSTQFDATVVPDGRIESDEIARIGFEPLTTGRLVGRDSWNLTILDDDRPLVVEIRTPPDSLRTNKPDWIVTWRIDSVEQPRKDTTFTTEGWNCVERSATDRFGRVFSDTNCIWLDRTPPQVAVFKITGPNPHDRNIDTTWWGDRAKTRWGKDTVWYEVRDSVLKDDESGWYVLVDTLFVVTDLRGDREHAVPVAYCDSVGNCGADTGWIELRQLVPLAVGGAYLDRDRDGRIDALVVELSRPWDVDFLPTFDAPLPPESRRGLRPDPAHPFVTTGGVADSTRFLVPVVEPFRFGVTSFAALQGALWEDWTTETALADSFAIRDSVPPVILKSEIWRVENYRDPDTVYVTPSEPLVLGGGSFFQVASCPDGGVACVDSLLVWTEVPARSVESLPDGRYRLLVSPGIDGSVRPGFHLRFLGGVSDGRGNTTDPANLRWASVVAGGPRPDLVRVTVDRVHVGIPSHEAERRSRGGILIRATRGNVTGEGASRQWWERGRGYLPDQDPSVRSICPDIRYCNGPTLYINRPVKMIIYIYDNAGTYVASREVEITQDDIDAMAPDQIDRLSIELAWNHRDPGGQMVATGVYIWRILSTMRVEGSSLPVIDNQLFRLGVSIGE